MTFTQRFSIILLMVAAIPLMTSHAEEPMHNSALKNDDGTWKYTNRLQNETSPYLLQHAHNPVQWYAWGDEAFKASRESGKPIFLSVGYSTCYWCHVMERQSFENPAIAAIMNEHFINVKVDREERPDVDDIYMTALQMASGRGGWPMNVFLTPPGSGGDDDPGLKPFFVGTYFPPARQGRMPGFPDILNAMAKDWKDNKQDIIARSEKFATAVAEQLSSKDIGGELSPDLARQTASALLQMYDKTHGGFGGAPKFPTPNNLDFLIEYQKHAPPDQAELSSQAVEWTLERMARGGMYDQIGGGFHRYSVDEQWLVPHFEKMLYDNGQLLKTYADAHALKPHSKDPDLYPRVMRGIADYILREMRHENGTFYSAQDAEVDAREGGNYVWTKQQVIDALKPLNDESLTKLALDMYGLDLGTNFQDPHHADEPPVNVIFLPEPLHDVAKRHTMTMEQLLDAKNKIDAALLEVRDKRKQPGTDDKLIAAWNGMMIAGLARAGAVLEEPKYIEAAARAAEVILFEMRSKDDGLLRTMRDGEAKIDAFLEDYAFLTQGLIELYRATDDKKWFITATSIMDEAEDRFAAEQGGYFDTLADQKDLFVRTRGYFDGAISSGNAQMANNYAALFDITASKDDLAAARNIVESLAGAMKQYGPGMAGSQRAALRVLQHSDDQPVAAEPVTTATTGPVTATVEPKSITFKEGKAVIRVSLVIEDGFHINANKPGLKWLIPTTVAIDGQSVGITASRVEYPDGEQRKYEFAEDHVAVYEKTAIIELSLDRSAEAARPGLARVTIDFQACTEEACLASSSIDLIVPVK